MHTRLFFLTAVSALSVSLLAADAFAQPPGRDGRGGRGAAAPAGENEQPAAGRGGRGGAGQSGEQGPGQAGAGGRFGGATGGVNKLFATIDANGDGTITAAEMEEAMQAFVKLDENKDGKLTKD